MTFAYTTTLTFTKTHADYLASKVAADLRQMRLHYGEPFEADIDAYLLELSVLLQEGCLDWVKYGMRRNGEWITFMKYDASTGLYVTDDKSGRVPAGIDATAASFYSYLSYSWKWSGLTETERDRIGRRSGVTRSSATEPSSVPGYSSSDKTYSNGGVSLSRSVFRPL